MLMMHYDKSSNLGKPQKIAGGDQRNLLRPDAMLCQSDIMPFLNAGNSNTTATQLSISDLPAFFLRLAWSAAHRETDGNGQAPGNWA